MTQIDKHEKRVALRCFRALSYLKTIKLYHEDRNYLVNEMFCYFFYELEYFRLMEDKKVKDANLASKLKATKLSNIVQFFERHNKFAYYHLNKIFDTNDWKVFASDVIVITKKKKDYEEDTDESDE